MIDLEYTLKVFDLLIDHPNNKGLTEIWCSPDLYDFAPLVYRGIYIYTTPLFDDSSECCNCGKVIKEYKNLSLGICEQCKN